LLFKTEVGLSKHTKVL